jgi:hypothetical protein
VEKEGFETRSPVKGRFSWRVVGRVEPELMR